MGKEKTDMFLVCMSPVFFNVIFIFCELQIIWEKHKKWRKQIWFYFVDNFKSTLVRGCWTQTGFILRFCIAVFVSCLFKDETCCTNSLFLLSTSSSSWRLSSVFTALLTAAGSGDVSTVTYSHTHTKHRWLRIGFGCRHFDLLTGSEW